MSIATTKTEVDIQIKNLKQAIYVGFAAYELLGDKEAHRLLNKPPHDQIILNWSLYPERYRIEREEFLKLLLRAMIKEPFEVIKAYCNDTRQMKLFESQSWYEFARLTRNAVSHNFRFEFTSHDKSDRLPVTWRGKTIESNMDGQELSLKFLVPDDVWYLVEDMHTFVKSPLLK